MEGSPEPTFPCSICGRKFIKSSLEKHVQACKKIASLHRKPFDSGKQRATGSDITYADVKKAQKEKTKNGGIFPRPQTNWRERHGNFIDAVSSSKRVDYALKTGAPLPPPPRTAVPSDYVQCEYCGRNFNAQAAERHIPFCRDQASRKQGNMKASIPKSVSGSFRNLPSKHESRGDNSRDSSASRMQTRGRDGSLSRNRADSHTDLTNRRKSLETRSTLTSSQAASRNVSMSAGQRHSGNLPPTTPSRRSTSASRNMQASAPSTASTHRLKTPAPPQTRSSSRSSSKHRDEKEGRLSQARNNSRNATRSRIF